MIANYHSHTVRCGHAVGEEREYVENAIANGIKILGFSDHAPYPEYTYNPNARMRVLQSDVDSYFKILCDLKKEYEKDIEIHIGFEAEYFPKYYGEFKEFLKGYPLEYFILGQHFAPSELEGEYTGRKFDDPEKMVRYADICIEAFNTGDFTYWAHPDIVRFEGDREFYKEQMKRVLKVCKEKNIPVEFNLLGFETNRWYPCDTYLELVKEVGNDIVLGSDAHEPSKCGNTEIAAAGEKKLSEFGLVPIETVNLIQVKL